MIAAKIVSDNMGFRQHCLRGLFHRRSLISPLALDWDLNTDIDCYSSQCLRFWLVDDDPNFTELLSRFCRPGIFRLHRANGWSAARIGSTGIDLILLT